MSRRAGNVAAAVATVWATAVLVVGCGLVGDDDSQGTASTPASEATGTPAVPPEEALRLYVQRRLNQGFVAECDAARRPDDVGKQCARLRGTRDGMRAYELGPTFGEYTRFIILEQVGDSWTILHLERRDPNSPPAPGIPWPLRVGASVVVAGVTDCLRVRERPGLLAGEVACLEAGTAVTISSGPVVIDEHDWWQLEGYDGWSASNWLRYPAEAGVATATPEE